MELREKIVLVTGGAKRIGQALVLALAKKGCHTAFTYQTSVSEAMETAKQVEALGVSTLPLQIDLQNTSTIPALVEKVEKDLGPISILINNASRFEPSPWPEVSERDFDADLAVNLKAPFFLSQAVAPGMVQRGEGKILNIADGAGERPYLTHIPYSLAKAGLVTLTRALAKKLAPQVSVTAIAPGPILFPKGLSSVEQANVINQTPLGRLGSPMDIVSAAMFLLEGSDFVTGHVYYVDGGRFL